MRVRGNTGVRELKEGGRRSGNARRVKEAGQREQRCKKRKEETLLLKFF